MKRHKLFVAALLLTGLLMPGTGRSEQPLVLAHYMPWFRAETTPQGITWEHWQWYGKGKKHDPDTVLPNGRRDIASVFYPLIGPYDQMDRAVLEYHVLTALASGIDGFVADWYGPGTRSDRVFGELVASAERYGIKTAICLEEKSFFPGYSQAKTRAEVLDVMQAQIQHVLDKYAGSDAYLRHNGEPVFFIFNGYGDGQLGPMNLSPEEVANVLGRFTNETVLLVRGYFTGAYAGIARGSYLWCDDAKTRAKFYDEALPARDDGKLDFVVGVASPGFNDTGVNGWGNGPRITDRRGTKEYEENWAEVLERKPDAVQVATWNDFEEGTTVEPSEEYGFDFLTLTEQFAAKFCGVKANLGDQDWPLRLYRLRLLVRGIGDEAARADWNERLDQYAFSFSEGRRFAMGWRLKRLESGVRSAAAEQAKQRGD
jgi:hypothetical protein